MKNKKTKIVELLKKAEYERKLYEKSHRFTNLSQACEKTWVAFVLALEYISKTEIKSPRIIFNTAQEYDVIFIQYIMKVVLIWKILKYIIIYKVQEI